MIGRPTMPEAGALRPVAAPEERPGFRGHGSPWRLAYGAAASLTLHAAAAGAAAAVLAWRAAPVPPAPQSALQVVWLDARPAAGLDAEPPPIEPPEPSRDAPPPTAPVGETVTEGLEPEDALATMLPDSLPTPAEALAPPEAQPPAWAEAPVATEAQAPAPAAAPTAAAAPAPAEETMAEAPAALAEAAKAGEAAVRPLDEAPKDVDGPAPAVDRDTALAALAVPFPPPPSPPPPRATEAPPPAQPPPVRRERPPRRPPANAATPPPARPGPPDAPRTEALAPLAPAAPAEAPFVSGPPRFRRPPAPPEYPALARERGDEGTVGLRLLVAADGATREVQVRRSSGSRLLDEAALAAARRWEVEPPSVGGRRIDAWVEVPVRFRLEQ